jgi:predicted MFS family arabinose efflux permease
MNRLQWIIVIFVSFIHLIAFAHRMEVVPFLVDLTEFYGVGYKEAGGLMSAFLLGYAFFQIPAGTLSDKYSPKRLIVIGSITMSISALLFAATDSLLYSLILRFFMGASSAMIFSPGIKMISSHTPKEKRGLSIGILEAAAGLGMLLALTLFPILSSSISWNYLFLGLSVILLPVLLIFLYLPGRKKAETNGYETQIKKVDFFNLFRNGKVLRLLGISFFGLFGLYGFIVWFPTYLESSLGYTKNEVGMIMAVTMIFQVIAAPVSGRVSDWMGQRKLTLIFGSALMLFASIWLLIFQGFGIYFISIVIGTGISFSMAPMLTLATEVVSVSMAGSVISVMNTVGQIASAISGYVFGFLYDFTGHFFLVWAACCISFIIRIIFCLGKLEDTHVEVPHNQGEHA